MDEPNRHFEHCKECGKLIIETEENREIYFFGDKVEVSIYNCGCGKEFFKIREALDDLHWRQMPSTNKSLEIVRL